MSNRLKPPPRARLPIASLSVAGLGPARYVGAAGRMELLALWDRLSDEGKRFVLTMARAKAEEEKRE